MDFDVFIAGAGPAGCATALSLAQCAPELRVALADAPPRQIQRIGEAVPPPIRRILEHLGLSEKFEADGHSASYRTLSAWGSAPLGSNEFLLHPQQIGWRLDRARFDAMLRAAAVAQAALHVPSRLNGLTQVDEAWRVACADGAVYTTRVVVDATGRAATLARLYGLRPTSLDMLVGCFVHCEGGSEIDPELMLETFRDGWWYTAAIPGGRRVVACMSDADIVRRIGLGKLDGWMRALAETQHVAAAAAGMQPLGPPRVRPAGSQIQEAVAPHSLISVGDAASCFDPISAQGIVKALRSGIFASYAIADWLRRGDAGGMGRYRSLVRSEFAAYRETLRDYYALERRWPDRPFWQRRGDQHSGRVDSTAARAVHTVPMAAL